MCTFDAGASIPSPFAQAEGVSSKLRRVRRRLRRPLRLKHSQAWACAHKCVAMQVSGGGPPLRCYRCSPRCRRHPLQGFAQHQRCAALAGTPPGGEVSARAGRSVRCTWRAACLCRAARSARSPRPCGAPFGGFLGQAPHRAAVGCEERQGRAKISRPTNSTNARAVQKFARRGASDR